jgi:hypothetical protein
MLPVNLERKMVANSLEAPTQVNTAPVTSIGSVAAVGGFALRPTPLGTFRFTFANATDAAVNYKIGDETGLIAAVNNLTVVAATSGTVTPAIFNKVCSLGGTAIGIKSVNYEVTAPAQFANNLKQYIADVDGNGKFINLVPDEFRRNNQFNANLLTMEFQPGEVTLAWNRMLFLTVNATTTVTLTFTPFGATGRV